MSRERTQILQGICRHYLSMLTGLSDKYGLKSWLTDIIEQNKRGECVSTEEEVEMLTRIVDEERLRRTDVPKLLGKSYRQSYENGDFEKIKKLRHNGIYSRVSTLLFKNENDGNEQEKV